MSARSGSAYLLYSFSYKGDISAAGVTGLSFCILAQSFLDIFTMAEELAALKSLQAGLNATFEAIFAATTPKKRALAKEQLIGLGFATATTAMGPAFAIIQLSATVSSASA